MGKNGFEPNISSLIFKKMEPTCMCALPTELRNHIKF